MAPAEDVVVALEAASASGRRRGQRELGSWGAVFCFGSRRRERRTVPVDGDQLVSGAAPVGRDVMRSGGADGNKETWKGPRLKGCCFLTPAARPPPGRRKHAGTMDSGSGRSTHDKQQQLEHTKEQQQERQPRSPSSEPVPWQIQPTAGGSRSRRAEAERPRGAGVAPAETRSTRPMSGNEEPSKCVGAFGPVVGLSVVAAVSMAGLLGGRVWAVACVCAWLAMLSGLRHGRERRR